MTTITHDLGHGMGNDWEYKDWATSDSSRITPPATVLSMFARECSNSVV